MGKTPERSLDASYDHRYIRPQPLKYLGIYCDCPVRSSSKLSVRSVCVFMTQTPGCGIMVDHGIHRPGVHCKIQPWSAQLAEVPQVILPVRLWHHSYPVTEFFEVSGYTRRTETRMIHKGVTCKEDHVYVVPSEPLNFLYGSRYFTFAQAVQFQEYSFLYEVLKPGRI